MLSQKKTVHKGKISWNITKPRLAVWCVMLLVCICFSALVMTAPAKIEREYAKVDCQMHGVQAYALQPGGTITQQFIARGQSTGEVSHLYLNILREESSTGSLSVRLYREKTGELLADITEDFAALPGYENTEGAVQASLAEPVMLGDGWFLLKSGEHYRLEISNGSERDMLYLLGNEQVQSGRLLVDGEQKTGFLNLSWMRKSLYTPSRLLLLLVLLTDATVLLGLALVLFTDIKTHVLYLILAVGFGVVTLFDLTPIYGFDMRFQFDSIYVLSNRMMGEDIVWTPDAEEPNGGTVSYYRRYCDDYSQYQFYKADEVSANYTDTKAGLRSLFASEEEREPVLVRAEQGFISEQLYLYLPQAIGFTIARLLGLGMYPMLQLARLLAYAVFVAVMYFVIRRIPFGKLVFLVSALIPTVMVQMVSLTRDAMIICMSFYVTAKVLQLAFAEEKPKRLDWIKLAVVSVLLAPCKMIYLPVSCLFLLVVYRHYIIPAGDKAKKLVMKLILAGLGVCLVFAVLNLPTIISVLFGEHIGAYQDEVFTVSYMLANPAQLFAVIGNTLRTQFGSYFVNAVQLFDINLGCSDGITIIVFVVLALGCCCEDTETRVLRKGERSFMLLAATGVFLLAMLAALRWTPADSDVIAGLQGRYLTPVLPLVCLACCNNRTIRANADAAVIVKGCCCVFPAISLMNMFLWTIAF